MLFTCRAIVLHTQPFVLPTYCTTLYLLYSVLHISAWNLCYPQEYTSLFDVHLCQRAHPCCTQGVYKSSSSDLICLKIMFDARMFGHSFLYFNNYFYINFNIASLSIHIPSEFTYSIRLL